MRILFIFGLFFCLAAFILAAPTGEDKKKTEEDQPNRPRTRARDRTSVLIIPDYREVDEEGRREAPQPAKTPKKETQKETNQPKIVNYEHDGFEFIGESANEKGGYQYKSKPFDGEREKFPAPSLV